MAINHDYPFDPTCGYSLGELLGVGYPPDPPGFVQHWRSSYAAAMAVQPAAEFRDLGTRAGRRVLGVRFTSVGGVRNGGWLTVPATGPVERGLVIAHGYGGRAAPDLQVPVDRAAILFPVLRGLPAVSLHPDIPSEPGAHVVHGIEDPHRYALGGCAADIWVAASVLLDRFPEAAGHLGYLGVSFGGGVGAMALAFDGRFARGHLEVPSFGHHPLRNTLPAIGSLLAVQALLRGVPGSGEIAPDLGLAPLDLPGAEPPRRLDDAAPVIGCLALHDAATAAAHITIPMHVAAAAFDPAVPPPGQFAVYNAIRSPKRLFELDAGHHPYPGEQDQRRALTAELRDFFALL